MLGAGLLRADEVGGSAVGVGGGQRQPCGCLSDSVVRQLLVPGSTLLPSHPSPCKLQDGAGTHLGSVTTGPFPRHSTLTSKTSANPALRLESLLPMLAKGVSSPRRREGDSVQTMLGPHRGPYTLALAGSGQVPRTLVRLPGGVGDPTGAALLPRWVQRRGVDPGPGAGEPGSALILRSAL